MAFQEDDTLSLFDFLAIELSETVAVARYQASVLCWLYNKVGRMYAQSKGTSKSASSGDRKGLWCSGKLGLKREAGEGRTIQDIPVKTAWSRF